MILPNPSTGAPGGGPTTYYGYDTNGNLWYTTSPMGTSTPGPYTTWYFYDGLNRQTCVVDATADTTFSSDVTPSSQPADSTMTTYNALGGVASTIDESGNVITYQYDNLGRETAETQYSVPDSCFATPSVPEPGAGYEDDPSGSAWTFTGHGGIAANGSQLGNPNAPEGAQAAFVQDSGSFSQSIAFSATGTYTIGFQAAYGTGGADSFEVLVGGQNLGTFTPSSSTSYQSYHVTFSISATGAYTVEFLGQGSTSQTSLIDGVWIAAGSLTTPPATTYTYDRNGNQLSTTDPDGNTTWTSYDALNRPVRTVSADGNGPNDPDYATTTTCDAVGNVTSVTDPDGNVTRYSYDRLNRQVSTTNPLMETSTTKYDADGNVIQTTDFNGQVIQYVYDALNRQIEELWLNSSSLVTHMVQTTYDAASQVISVTESDANNPSNGTCYQYAYDYDGRLASSRMAPDDLPSAPTLVNGQLNANSPTWSWNGSTEPYEWFIVGTSLSAGNVICATMHADTFSPTVSLLWWNGSEWTGYCWTAATGKNDITEDFTIPTGESGEWIVLATAAAMVNGNFALQVQVDPTVATAVPSALTELDYTYYADGSVHTVTDSSNVISGESGTTTYAYDANGNMTQAQQSLNGAAANEVANMTYYGNGSVNTIARDAAGSVAVATSSYTYDGMGRLSTLDNTQGGNPLDNYTFSYDNASNMTSMTSTIDGTDNYTLDDANQVTGASLPAETFSYDQNGNKTGGGYVTGANNRLLADGTYNYVYDKNGNLIQQTQISNGHVTEYTWDFENRLAGVTYYNSLADAQAQRNATQTVAYTYDYLGREISEAVTIGATTTYSFFAYDGGNEPIVEYSTSSGRLAESDRYLTANGQILADDQLSAKGAGSVWILTNNNGSACDLMAFVNGGWTLATHQFYSAVGVVSVHNYVGSVTTLVGFDGGLTDSATGLIKYGARWYNPTSTVWTSPDPAHSGTNLYEFCGNNTPVDVDPTGMTLYSNASAAISNARDALQQVHNLQNTGASAADVQAAYATYQQSNVAANQAVTNYLQNGFGRSFYGSGLSDQLNALPVIVDGVGTQNNTQYVQQLQGQATQQGQSLQSITNQWDTTYKVGVATEYACAGVVVGAGVALVVIAAAPVLVAGGAAGLMLAGVGEATAIAAAQATVSVGLCVAGGYGIVTTGRDMYQNASAGNWNAVAFDAGTIVGGSLVCAGGGGRALAEGMMGEPSPAPNTWNPITLLSYELANVYKPSKGPPGLNYWATCPTPLSGGAAATGIAGWVGSTMSSDTSDTSGNGGGVIGAGLATGTGGAATFSEVNSSTVTGGGLAAGAGTGTNSDETSGCWGGSG